MKKQIEKYIENLKDLIKYGKEIANLEKPTKNPKIKTIQDGDKLQAWLIRVENAVILIFGEKSIQYSNYLEFKKKKAYYSSTVREIYGFLEGCLNDLEKGLIVGLEFLFLNETFSDILGEAKELNSKGYMRSAAIYCRIVVENSLKKLSQREKINLRKTASQLNDELKNRKIFDKVMHNKIKGWLLIGNEAAHKKNFNRKKDELNDLIINVKKFVKTEFGDLNL